MNTRTSCRITGSGSSTSSESLRRTCPRAGSVNSALVPSHVWSLIGSRFAVHVRRCLSAVTDGLQDSLADRGSRPSVKVRSAEVEDPIWVIFSAATFLEGSTTIHCKARWLRETWPCNALGNALSQTTAVPFRRVSFRPGGECLTASRYGSLRDPCGCRGPGAPQTPLRSAAAEQISVKRRHIVGALYVVTLFEATDPADLVPRYCSVEGELETVGHTLAGAEERQRTVASGIGPS